VKKEIITTLQRGKDYSLWYYFRYYPSINRLKEKLNEKTNKNQDLINKIFNEVWHLFNDINVLESKVQNFLFRNKNKKYIITNLLQKKFLKSDIEKTLNQFTNQWESLLSENFIERKIYQFIQKNKSKQYIRNKLIEQPEDKELVENILNKIFNEDNEVNSIKKEIEKLNNKNLDQQKIIQRLISKWFRYDDIKKAL
jgi:SOS response regulatory protein OraA/RecX